MIHQVREVDGMSLEARSTRRRRRHRFDGWRWLVPLIVFWLALPPRFLDPSPFLTWDEPTWTYRSLQFLRALERGAPQDTWQSPHPGVVTLWLGAAGMTARRMTLPENGIEPSEISAPYVIADGPMTSSLNWVDGLPPFDEEDVGLLRRVLPWLDSGRAAVAVATSLLVALAAGTLVGLVGVAGALVAGALMAWDPWLLAHSRVLHLDGLLALLMLCCVLAGLRWIRGEDRAGWRWLALSAVLGGLAVLEKSPGVYGVGFTGVLFVIVGCAQGGLTRTNLVRLARAVAAWSVVVGITYVAAWPAMWAAPLDTMARMAGYAMEATSTARESLFFRGRVQPDPGVVFYLVSTAFRMSPLVCLGALVGIPLAIRDVRRGRLTVPILWAFALLYLLAMGLGAKKFVRYALPVAPALDVVAGIGLVGVARLAVRWRGLRSDGRSFAPGFSGREALWRAMVPLALGTLVIVQGIAIFGAHPHYLAWYNPLLGGAPSATRWIPVGWGEGTEAAVAWLNGQARSEDLVVATPSIGLIGPGFRGRTTEEDAWRTADFALVYHDDVQAGEPEEVTQIRSERAPVRVFRLRGVPYVWIYGPAEGTSDR